MDIDTFKPTFLIQIEGQTLSADITQEITSFVFEDNEEELDVLELAVTGRNRNQTAWCPCGSNCAEGGRSCWCFSKGYWR
jgi:hypothetical protein